MTFSNKTKIPIFHIQKQHERPKKMIKLTYSYTNSSGAFGRQAPATAVIVKNLIKIHTIQLSNNLLY